MKLSVKFSGAVLLLVAVSLGLTAWLLIRRQTQNLNDETLERSRIILSMGQASREYARFTLSPAVRKAVNPHKVGLIFEADSATFVARGTFDAFRKRKPDYSFREAATNPLNLANKADEREQALIRRFIDGHEKEEFGFITQDGRERFFVARPIFVRDACMQCHDTPERAPPELVARYGSDHGFGWREGEVAGAIIVTVPTDDLRASQRGVVWTVVATFSVLAVLLVLLLHLLFEWVINRRLRQATAHVKAVAADPGGTLSVPEEGNDELTALAKGCNEMADRVRESHHELGKRVAERTLQLLDANRALAEEVGDRRRAEETARDAMLAAEAASRAKGQFLANVSHEIRTPMNGVLGMTELALGTELTPEQRDYLQMAHSSAQSLLTVINDVLDFSKIEAGKMELDPVPFGLRDLIADALRALAVRAHGKGLELAYHVAADVPDKVVGDAGRLRQVLTNLIGNAVKFTAEGEVVVRVIPLTSSPPNVGAERGDVVGVRGFRFEVTDTGVGIAPEKLERIFQPFEQADGSTTRQYGGTGLGLAISARLVEMMGGRISVCSEPGKGSTFSFTARLGSQKHDGAARSEEPSCPAGLRVLVVDDVETSRRHLEEMLHGWRFHPTVAAGAEEAMVALKTAEVAGEPFELVVVGARHGDDALNLTEHVRQRPELADVPIVLLCHTTRPLDAGRCDRLRVTRRLVKPVKPSELFDTIVKAVQDRKTRPCAAAPAAAAAPARSLRVLVAEDNPVNQMLAVRLLEKHGHQVTVVGDGQAAVEAVESAPFDVVLMDVQMPVLGGYEATALIRQREAQTGVRMPIVAMTANAMKGDREACLAAGMDGYVAKPVQAKQLIEVLVQVTNGQSSRVSD